MILEGPDRAGKTTLGTLIKTNNKSQMVHIAGSKVGVNGKIVRHWTLASNRMRLPDKNVVYDRMVMGSLVYAFKNDKHNILPVSPSEYGEWLAWMTDRQNLLICCLPDVETLLVRMEQGEAYITKDDMVTVHRRYGVLFDALRDDPPNFPVLFYNSAEQSALEFYTEHKPQIVKALS